MSLPTLPPFAPPAPAIPLPYLALRTRVLSLLAWAALFALLACAMRMLLNYPLCVNDEKNWIGIAQQLDQGVAWPVSGPAFVNTLRQAAWVTGSSHAEVMPWMGVCGVFIVVGGLSWGYYRLGLKTLVPVFATLALSSYFWAPLLEARPQQWGQLAVFLGTISAWRWLQHRGGLAFFVALPAVAFTHILSHAVLVFLCLVLVATHGIAQRRWSLRHLAIALLCIASFAVYAWPGGPYTDMLRDLRQAHFRHWPLSLPASLALLVAVAAVAWASRRWWHGDIRWPAAALAGLLRHQRAAGWSLCIAALLVLTMQAYLLPPEAWAPYGGSWIRFLLFQSGNLLLAGFLLVGAGRWLGGFHQQRIDPGMARFLVCVLAGIALLGLLAVAASWWLLDTNWMLRVLNYGIFFAAAPAALGMEHVTRHWPRWRRGLLLGAGMAASVLAVVRPPMLLGC